MYTPELAGKDEGEDFADAFAGALLFPKELAQLAYADAARKHSASSIIGAPEFPRPVAFNFGIQRVQ